MVIHMCKVTYFETLSSQSEQNCEKSSSVLSLPSLNAARKSNFSSTWLANASVHVSRRSDESAVMKRSRTDDEADGSKSSKTL